ncbi:MAG: hypothetical protein AB8B58_11175 [Roseobacter sp.]
MFAAMFPTVWLPDVTKSATGPTPPRRSTPVFIGDTTLPYGRDTMLLEIMRKDEAARGDQS